MEFVVCSLSVTLAKTDFPHIHCRRPSIVGECWRTALYQPFDTGPPGLHQTSAIWGLRKCEIFAVVKSNCPFSGSRMNYLQFLFVCLTKPFSTRGAPKCFLSPGSAFSAQPCSNLSLCEGFSVVFSPFHFCHILLSLPARLSPGWQLVINEPIQQKQKLDRHLLCKTSGLCLAENRTKPALTSWGVIPKSLSAQDDS